MDSTSVYGLELLVLEGTGGKALATDHRVLYETMSVKVLTNKLLCTNLLYTAN